jgi:lysophospholipase L1-like esterase
MMSDMDGSSIVRAHPEAARAAVLAALEQGYPVLVIGLVVLTALFLALFVWRRRLLGRARSMAARATVAGSSVLLVLMVVECSVAAYLSWLHRMPRLAMVNAPPRTASTSADATIAVVGESSAEGVPYRDWLSVGKIVVWQLRRLFPGQMFHLEVQARPGWTLEKMHQKLAETQQRPDVVILYAGHNEFSARFGWSCEVPYYRDEPHPWWPSWPAGWVSARSPICQLLREARDQALVAAPPPPRSCALVDVPSYTAEQFRERLADFRRRTERILSDLANSGVLTIVIVPPGNDAGFEPNRSVLPPVTPHQEREAFTRSFLEVRALESTDPHKSIERYRALLAEQPGFAETHFRLARLLQQTGAYEEAYREYVQARDLDGHPMRCPTPFQDICRQLAPRFGAVLVDGQKVFHAHHPHGLLDDNLFNDGMHPSFEGTVTLAQAVLAALRERHAFGWPTSLPAPSLKLADCANHFDVTIATWKNVCRFAAGFYRITRRIRFDPAEREAKERLYLNGLNRLLNSLNRLETGLSPDQLDVPGVGIRPVTERITHSQGAISRLP